MFRGRSGEREAIAMEESAFYRERPLFPKLNKPSVELNLRKTKTGNNGLWVRGWSYTLGFICRGKRTAINVGEKGSEQGAMSVSASPVIIWKLPWHSAIIFFVMTGNSWGWILPDCYVIKNCVCEKQRFHICKQCGPYLFIKLPRRPPLPSTLLLKPSRFFLWGGFYPLQKDPIHQCLLLQCLMFAHLLTHNPSAHIPSPPWPLY